MEMLTHTMTNIFAMPSAVTTALVLFSAALLLQIFVCYKTRRILSRLFAIIISGFAIAVSSLVFSGTLELEDYAPEISSGISVMVSSAALPILIGLVLGYIIYIAATIVLSKKPTNK